MRMAEDDNLNFNYGGVFPPSFGDQNVVSFQTGPMNNATGLMSQGMYNSGDVSSTTGMILPGKPATLSISSSMMSLPGNLSGKIILDPAPPLKQNPATCVGWSLEELFVLKQGLAEYATEPNIMKYIKIAARLPEKTVRDVAMRCQLIAQKESGKRRKLENYYAEKKENMMYSPSISTMHSIQSDNVTTFPLTARDMPSNNQLPYRAPINIEMQRLLIENFNLLHQIGSNLELSKTQDNADLFYRTKNNITTILNSMNSMPGIMSRMPSLPVAIDDNLLESILSLTCQVHVPRSAQLKEETRYW